MKLLLALILLILLAAGGMSVALRNHDQDRRANPPRAHTEESTPVPEPMTMVLVGGGLCLAALAKKFKR